MVNEVNDKNFQDAVIKAELPTLVDFWAPWCGPCRTLAPVLEEIAKTYSGRANVIKVNVDDAPKTTESYGVRSIPTLVFIRDGKVRETISGLATHDKLAALIDQNMPG